MSKISDDRLAEVMKWAALEEIDCMADDRPITAELYGDAVFALTELLALRSGGEEKDGVGVKPLEWKDGHGVKWPPGANSSALIRSAYGLGVHYTIHQYKLGGFSLLICEAFSSMGGGVKKLPFETVDLAQIAAQADYERRILSSLTNTEPSLRAENERLRHDNSDLLAAADADGHVIRQLEARVADLKAKLDDAVKVLEPFADAVFNDNGDITPSGLQALGGSNATSE